MLDNGALFECEILLESPNCARSSQLSLSSLMKPLYAYASYLLGDLLGDLLLPHSILLYN